TIIVERSAEDLFEFWRHFERLPVIMNHLESVEMLGHNRSRWVAKAPAGMHVEWDAEIINEHPNELIAWRSLEGADVENAGTVRFQPAPGGRGTLVKVDLEYIPPAGVIGAKIAKLFGESPEKQITVDLRRFKQLMETGEIARTEGQPAGRATSTSKKYDDFVRT
ncbi:MAG: cyclase/dehydrase, partial [Verrucomicrobiales bacterium]|nr:cyclase/dehydrase [Verrucomicrobiales bacterium]